MPKNTKPRTKTVQSPVYTPARRIPEWTRTYLCTRAGGRCEFDGCQRYLLKHHVTFTAGNFAENAHMVAFSEQGPRGFKRRPRDIHSADNLMLLCPTCHKLIDDNPDKYTLKTLQIYKKSHEDQIYHLTGLRPEMKTSHLVVRSRVRDQTVEIPFDHILEALSPRHPLSQTGYEIDLTAIPHGPAFTATACETIEHHLKSYFSPNGEVASAKHISLFALAPIPTLMFLGYKLGNKVPLDLFQRHRNTEKWRWKDGHATVEYLFRQLRTGSESGKVALLLPLSGPINLVQLPADVGPGYNIYEIAPSNTAADPTLIKTRADLENFRLVYQQAIAALIRAHPSATEIALLPAVPAPIAVLCGRELLPRIHPALRVYDHDKDRGYQFDLTINQ